jgi:hypothetical protein
MERRREVIQNYRARCVLYWEAGNEANVSLLYR